MHTPHYIYSSALVIAGHLQHDFDTGTHLSHIFLYVTVVLRRHKTLYPNLAVIVEELSGQDYNTFLENEFFIPLDMVHTGNWADPRFNSHPMSKGYMNGASSGPINEIPGPYWTVIGNGEVSSTVDDMLVWYKALHASEVLSAESTQAIFRSYTTSKGENINYGYGWEVSENERLGRVITHFGGGLTGNSILIDYLDRDLKIIILSNRITWQTLGSIPIVISLPADETSRAIAENDVSRDFSKLPRTTFVLWYYVIALMGTIALFVLSYLWFRHKRKQRTDDVMENQKAG